MLKKCFTIAELIITLAIITALYFASIPFQRDSAIRNSINEMANDVIFISENLIYNPITGYTTNTGKTPANINSDYCSKSFDVQNITPFRIKECTNNQKYFVEKDVTFNVLVDDIDYTKSWFVLGREVNSGCKVFIKNDDSYTTSLFFDCSQINSEYHSYIENVIVTTIKNKLDFYLSDDINKDSLTTSNGNSTDGKFLITLKK